MLMLNQVGFSWKDNKRQEKKRRFKWIHIFAWQGQDYEMFPIITTWDFLKMPFFPSFFSPSKYISEFTLIVMYLIGCGFVCWPNYKGSAYTLVGWEELGFMNLFPLLYCLNSFGLVLIPSSCLWGCSTVSAVDW